MKELSLNILDIAQNSVKAGATRIGISVVDAGTLRTVTVTDDGCGMSEAFVRNVTDPFTTTRTTRKVGLGLPLLKLAAEQTGGTLSIESKRAEPGSPEHGTTVTATFYTDHVDCEPLGDFGSTVVTLLQGSPEVAFRFRLATAEGDRTLDTDEMREMLGDDVPLNEPAVLVWAADYWTEPQDG